MADLNCEEVVQTDTLVNGKLKLLGLSTTNMGKHERSTANMCLPAYWFNMVLVMTSVILHNNDTMVTGDQTIL